MDNAIRVLEMKPERDAELDTAGVYLCMGILLKTVISMTMFDFCELCLRPKRRRMFEQRLPKRHEDTPKILECWLTRTRSVPGPCCSIEPTSYHVLATSRHERVVKESALIQYRRAGNQTLPSLRRPDY
jgi:hypothetical protein